MITLTHRSLGTLIVAAGLMASCSYTFDLEKKCARLDADGDKLPPECKDVDWKSASADSSAGESGEVTGGRRDAPAATGGKNTGSTSGGGSGHTGGSASPESAGSGNAQAGENTGGDRNDRASDTGGTQSGGAGTGGTLHCRWFPVTG